MDFGSGGWSSGCESGWTVYLDELSSSSKRCVRRKTADVNDSYYRRDKKEAEEDLSMVSDASSGPPPHNNIHHGDREEDNINVPEYDHDYDNCGGVYTRQVEVSSSKKKKMGGKKSDSTGQIPYKCTEDTASSHPLMIYPKGNSSAFDNQLGFWLSSNRQNPDSAELCIGRL